MIGISGSAKVFATLSVLVFALSGQAEAKKNYLEKCRVHESQHYKLSFKGKSCDKRRELRQPPRLQPTGQGSSLSGSGAPVRNLQLSDRRLKTDVHRVGTTAHGLALYDFSYTFKPGIYEGVMAQEVMNVVPSAVSVGANGYYQVDYGKLGIRFKRVK